MVQQNVVSMDEDKHRQEEINSNRVLPDKIYSSVSRIVHVVLSEVNMNYVSTLLKRNVMF
jgi:hypothetical protein